MKTRVPVPKDTEATVLFKSDHSCAICQVGSVQVAHMDNNNTNFKESNLIVLCLNHHDESHKKSPISKGYSPKELKKYKEDWEARVALRRKSINVPQLSRLIRFDGPDVNTVYLEVEPGVLRGFKDSLTFRMLGFNWGNVDVYPESDKAKFTIDSPLNRASECRKLHLRFANGTFANEVYIVWEDGKKHHIPDPETYKEIKGSDVIDSLDYKEFNTIPHGQPLLSIFTVRTRQLMHDAWEKH